MPSLIVNLPVEVLTEICGYLPANAPVPYISDLANVCRVNKLFHHIATPMLYRNVHLNYSSTFDGTSKILRCLLGSELEGEHCGIKFIRNLRVSEGYLVSRQLGYLGGELYPGAEIKKEHEKAKGGIREDIAKLMLKIGPNQLTSLYADTVDFEQLYRENLGAQNNLKNLHLRYGLDWSGLKAGPWIEDVAPAPPPGISLSEAWKKQIEPHISHLTDITASLRLSGLAIDIGLFLITEINIGPREPGSSPRPIGVTIIPFFSRLENVSERDLSRLAQDVQTLVSSLKSIDTEGFYLEGIDTYLPFNGNAGSATLSTVADLIAPTLGQLRELVARDWESSWGATTLLPLASNLTDLRIYSESYDGIGGLTCRLKVLYIIHWQQFLPEFHGSYVKPHELLPHAETLETLWLENYDEYGEYKCKIPIENPDGPRELSWNFLISDTFPRLREVAACIRKKALSQGLVGKNFETLRVLSMYPDQVSTDKVEEAFNSSYTRDPSSKLKAIAIGSPHADIIHDPVSHPAHPGLSLHDPEYAPEAAIFFGNREKDTSGQEVTRCTQINPRQAKFLLPEITIIEDKRWVYLED
ncbi:hypothetical protein TWF481_010143 [Arthrobotrys musiformis]|uniref:F-box domain-containing protein n=1 Tax=Arthrobotrys musiformis TaxID=47236 RepID=A0AAV9W111_9PEZI